MNPHSKWANYFALVCFGLAGDFALSQGAIAPEQTPSRVYRSTEGISAPLLVPPTFTINGTADCQNPASGTLVLAAIVDSSGRPQNVQFVRPLGNDLDRLAVKIVVADRFKPATHEGAAIASGVSIAITIQACDMAVTDPQRREKHRLQLRAQPEQAVLSNDEFPDQVFYALPDEELAPSGIPLKLYRVAGDVSAPAAFVPSQPISIGNSQGGKAKYQGVVLISLIVDAHGLPQNLKVIRPLGLGLDQKAVDAVTDYRFAPALRRRMQPVPVMITVEVNFRIY